jgi:nicotinamide riboside kinase
MTNRDYSSLLPEFTMEEIQKREERQINADNIMVEYTTKIYNGEHDKEHKKIIAAVLDSSGSVYNQVYRKKNKRYRQIHLDYPVYGMLEAKNYKMFYSDTHSVTIYLTDDFITQLQSIIKPYLEMDNTTLDKNLDKLVTRLGNIIASHIPYLDKCKRTVSKQIGRTIFINLYYNQLSKYNHPITVAYRSYYDVIDVATYGTSTTIELK